MVWRLGDGVMGVLIWHEIDVMVSLSKHVCTCINMIQAYTSK
jgi:hypothetical protein